MLTYAKISIHIISFYSEPMNITNINAKETLIVI